MWVVLGMATVLGVFAMLRSFSILYLGEGVFHLSQDTLRTLVYLNLSIGRHLTVFAARTRGPFWSIKPAPILLIAVVGTQLVATLIAVYELLMTPLGWIYAGIVWGYCIVLFLVQDRVKLWGYGILSHEHSGFLVKESKR